MPCLLLASVIWGFSFGILKDLTTELDPFVVNIFAQDWLRYFFALGFFLNLLERSKLPVSKVIQTHNTPKPGVDFFRRKEKLLFAELYKLASCMDPIPYHFVI